jgi:hypothetical protein
MLSFIPTLGTGEVFAFGAGVPLPTRMKFRELPVGMRPSSEAGGNVRAAGTPADRDMIDTVIDRWRASTMSHKSGLDDDRMDTRVDSWDDMPRGREEAPAYRTAPPLQPAAPAPIAPQAPAAPMAAPPAAAAPMPPTAAPTPPQAPAAPRPSILRKPISGAPGPDNPAPLPSRFRT